MTRLWPKGEPIEAWGTPEVPDGFYWHHVPQQLLDVCNRWKIHTRWWEPGQTVWREYWKVVTAAGMLCLIYRDVLTGKWLLTRVYD